MAQKKWKLSALWAMLEAAFSVDPDSDGSDYKFMKAAFDMSFTPAMDIIPQDGLMNSMTRAPHQMGAKGGALTFKLDVKGSGTVATDEVAAIAAEADIILQSVFGSVTRGTGSRIVAGGGVTSTTVLDLDAGDGVGFAKGMMVLVNCGATYGYVPRFVESIATDQLTLDRALPAIPAAAAAVQASSLYKKANTGHQSIAFVATKDDVQYTLLGCKVDSLKISGVQSRGHAVFEVSCSVSDWSKTSKASLPSTTLSGVTAVKAPIIKGACFAIGGTEEPVHALDLDFAHKFEFVDSTCAMGPSNPDSNNAGVELVDAAPAGSIHPYYADSHMTDFAAGTERSLAFAVSESGTAGNGWGVYIKKAQFGQPEFEEHNGMVGQSMPFMVNDNGSDAELYFSLA
jgi:hypothetical protein